MSRQGSPAAAEVAEVSSPSTPLTEFTTQDYNTILGNVDEDVLKDSRERKLARIKRRGEYSVDEAVEYIGVGKYHWLWMSLFGLSSMAQSVEVTLSSIILSDLGCDWDLTVTEEMLIPMIIILSSIPGDFIGGKLADKYGRYPILVAGQSLIAIFAVLSSFATSYAMYIVFRVFVGFGFGLIVFLIIVQVAEINPTAYRGVAVAVTFLMWTVGNVWIIVGAYWLEDDYGWRYVVFWAAIPCIVMFILMPFADESPKYLIVSGEGEKARGILAKIARWNGIEMCPGELVAIKETRRGRVMDMFDRQFLSVTIALIITMFCGNFIYMGAIYAAPMLLQYNYCSDNSTVTDSCIMTEEDFIYDMIIGCSEFLSIPLFVFSSEYLGRVRAANVTAGVLLFFIITLKFCFGTTVLVIELFFERALANAFLLLVYIYTPEFYPTYVRSVAFGVTMMCGAAGGVLAIVNVYELGLAESWSYMIYGFVIGGIPMLIATFYFGRETAGQRLEDNRPETVMSYSYSKTPTAKREGMEKEMASRASLASRASMTSMVSQSALGNREDEGVISEVPATSDKNTLTAKTEKKVKISKK